MPLAAVAVLLPTLFWDRPVDSASALRAAGIERLSVSVDQEAVWRKLGFEVTAFDRAQAVQAIVPKVEYRVDVASATRVPWLEANGWRFQREPDRTYIYDTPAGSAVLAAAEAFAYGVRAAIRCAPEDLGSFARMLKFLAEIGQPSWPVKANLGVVDDGSDTMGEVMNLLARHNLLFQVVAKPDAKFDLSIHRVPEADNPYEFAMQVRRELTDEKRLVRIYGSNVVLARLMGDGSHARVHLLNYGRGVVKGLRLRVLGEYASGKLSAFDHAGSQVEELHAEEGATEFSIREIGQYAVVDLRK